MQAMTMSMWEIGTYEMLLEKDAQRGDELCITLFALPTPEATAGDDDDSPILAQIDVPPGERDWDVQDWMVGLRRIGINGLLRPETVERIYGPRLTRHILLALRDAAECDFRGTDSEGRPWRTAQPAAGLLAAHVAALLADLTTRLAGM